MKVTGEVLWVGQTEVKSDKFKKRDIVIQTVAQFPETVVVQFANDKCDWLDKFGLANKVEVEFKLKAKQHNGRWFNSIEGWKIKTVEDGDDMP